MENNIPLQNLNRNLDQLNQEERQENTNLTTTTEELNSSGSEFIYWFCFVSAILIFTSTVAYLVGLEQGSKKANDK